MSTGFSKSMAGLSRRRFIRATTLAAGAAALGVPALLRGQNLNGKLDIAVIGAGGKGASDTDCCAGENIVALCDADQSHCAGQVQKYPRAKFYRDFREMLDEMGRSIDAVIVSTPDHFHAVAASAAIQLGKHVYCQKPLTQTIYESRRLRDLARQHRVVTQMGNQGSAEDGLRRAVECLRAGIIGPVREVHVWTDRPIWPQGMERPPGADPVPPALDWDLWIGPAPMRPFKSGVYHPFNWRGWQDFGTSALGDMGCHTVNMPFRALELGHPIEVEAECRGMNRETYPLASTVRFRFPSRGSARIADRKGAELLTGRFGGGARSLPPVTLWWYDGGQPKPGDPYRHDGSNRPPREITADVEAFRGDLSGSGCLIIGDNGKVFSPDDYGTQFFVKLAQDKKFVFHQKHPAVAAIPQTIPRNLFQGDADKRHHLEWIAAIKENKPQLCYSRFDLAAALTEVILLGCVALRAGRKLEWDGPAMRATNAPEAAPFLKRHNRPGWAA